jgi:hypothetical protein
MAIADRGDGIPEQDERTGGHRGVDDVEVPGR